MNVEGPARFFLFILVLQLGATALLVALFCFLERHPEEDTNGKRSDTDRDSPGV